MVTLSIQNHSVTVGFVECYVGWVDDRDAPPTERKWKRFLRGVVWNRL